MEICRTSPEAIGIFLSEQPFVISDESNIFLGQDAKDVKFAIKIYPTLPIMLIKEYAELTSHLANIVNDKGMTTVLDILGRRVCFDILVIPVLTMGISDDSINLGHESAYTISHFVDGETLYDLDRKYHSSNWSFSTSQDPLVNLSMQLRRISKKTRHLYHSLEC